MDTDLEKKGRGRPKKSRPPAPIVGADERQQHQQGIGQRIREQRELRGWSTAELAERAGVTPTLVQALEHGRNAPLTWTILLLARALNCGSCWLAFGG